MLLGTAHYSQIVGVWSHFAGIYFGQFHHNFMQLRQAIFRQSDNAIILCNNSDVAKAASGYFSEVAKIIIIAYGTNLQTVDSCGLVVNKRPV